MIDLFGATMPPSDTVYELRRYRLQPGAREALIALFEHEFIESQEATGMSIHGIYRDTADPDAFVWLRGFRDMAQRAEALAAFYGGPIWQRWGKAANATMLNSDNVLLLRPVGTAAPFNAAQGATGGITCISIAALAPGHEPAFADFWQQHALPLLAQHGARIDAAFITETAPNNFPRLPLRAGEPVFVWVSAFADAHALAAHQTALTADITWRERVFPALDRQLWRPLEQAWLTPTARSPHHW